MQVRQGWSGEVAANVWAKISIELDEGDLRRLLVEEGGFAPDVVEQVPVATAYLLLDAEAERLVVAKLVATYGFPVEEGRVKMVELNRRKVAALEGLRTRFTSREELPT